MKLLFGVDGSDGSLDAIRQIAPLLLAEKDAVAFYYSPPAMTFPGIGADDAGRGAHARQLLCDAVFAKAKECLVAPLAASAQMIVGSQPPKSGLVLAADECRADLIVLGARGSGPLAGVKLGGVARHVARTASVPVMVTRPRKHPAGEPFRLLLAADDSDASKQAGAALHYAHWPANAQGFVMTVVEPYFQTALPDWLTKQTRDPETEAIAANWAKEHELSKDQKRAELAAYVKTLPAPFAASEPIVAEGNPAEQILKTIAEKSIDLVVVGAQGKNAWQRFVIGSTSETLLAQAPCSVLIVRRREKP
ncbi:MAG: universal stress protein [Pirellulales bacterium]